MAKTICFKASSLYLVFLALVVVSSAQLSPSFYNQSCPDALSIIQKAVFAAVNQEARMGASLLRLHFHDCFVQGCDASVLLDSTSTMSSEKDAAPNMNSLRGFDVIDDIKSQLENVCPQTVSCADILTVAARDSVVALGGANWTVFLGRKDSLTANQNAANSDLPSPDSDLSTLISAFANKGLSTTDMIALSGAHTIGLSRCSVFQSSISSDTSTQIDPSFAASLQANCTSGVNNSTAPLDTTTPTIFDTKYYENLMGYKGLLHSDRVLYNNGSADSQVSIYAQNPYQFFTDFITGMINMGNISLLTGSDGEIRVNCRKTN